MADDEEEGLPDAAKALPPEVAKKIPWWGYALMTLLGSGALGSSGYVGSLFGAAQAAANNAEKIEDLEGTIASLEKKIDDEAKATAAREQASNDLVKRVDTMTKTLDKQNGRLERLTLVIATTSGIDINTLIPSSPENP